MPASGFRVAMKYEGPVKLCVFDWAGTVVDSGHGHYLLDPFGARGEPPGSHGRPPRAPLAFARVSLEP